MEQKGNLQISVLPNTKDPEFEQRESGIVHTSYDEEQAFYALIERGDTEAIQQTLQKYLSARVVVGHLSDNATRQMQYWAVCCITLGIRAAIRGGLDEMTAFNLSDQYIMQIDRMAHGEEIAHYLEKIVVELTQLVHEHSVSRYPAQIRRCLHYIGQHLHESIRIETLAEIAHFSPDYFCKYFKRHVGTTPVQYIMDQKLRCACGMIENGFDLHTIAYYLGFCSQTYFITCFKKAYSLTPHQYAVQHRK